jgi:hypothetical protein
MIIAMRPVWVSFVLAVVGAVTFLFYVPAWVAMIVAAVSSGGTKEAAAS